jgi:hypothetical protein
MARHNKRRVKQRSKAHQKVVNAKRKMRKKRKARSVATKATRKRTRAAQRKRK